jgi:Flp pilus assembly protein TadG
MRTASWRHGLWTHLRRLRATDGNVAVEYALFLPVLMILLAGIVDLGLALHTRSRLEIAAQAGLEFARYDRSDLAAVRSAVNNATGVDPTTLTVSVTDFCACADGLTIACSDDCADGTFPGTFVRVVVDTEYQGLLDLGLVETLFAVQGEAIGRVQ